LVTVFLFSACATTKKQLVSVPVKEKKQETVLPEEKKTEFEYLFIEGLKQKKLGSPQNAVTYFSKCLEIDPNSSATMFELANVHLANGDQTSASLLLEKAIQLNPDNKWYKILLAQIYQQSKQYEKAANLYGVLYAEKPEQMENLEYLYMKAGMLSSAEKYDESIAAFDQLESKLGFNEQVTVAKQQVYLAAGKKEKAVEEINKLIKLNPEETSYYGLMADLCIETGDSLKALDYYNQILKIDPENGFVHFSLAEYFDKAKQPEKAYEHIREGFKNQNLEMGTKLQMFLMLTADPAKTPITQKQTLELLGLLRAMYPAEYRVQALYADYLLQNKQLEEGRQQLRKVLETNKEDYVIWERLMLVDNELLDFENLYADGKKAIELFPTQPLFYALVAIACLQQEKYQEALKIIAEGEQFAVGNNPMKIQLELYKAEAYYKTNQVNAAFKAFDEVIKIDPENYLALNNYAYYLSIRNENLEKAARMSGKAVQANPTNSTYLDTYAWVLFMQKDYKLAKFYMDSAVMNGGDTSAVILEHYGDILYMLDEKEKALEYWKKAKAVGEGSEFLEEKASKGIYIEKQIK